MAFRAGVCYNFEADVANGVHDFATDTFKIALYVQASATTLNNQTLTTYTTTGEVTGTGYVAGGQTIAGLSAALSGGNYNITWLTNNQWTASTITTDSALIYNSSKSNKAIVIFSFGSVSSSGNTLTVQYPLVTLQESTT